VSRWVPAHAGPVPARPGRRAHPEAAHAEAPVLRRSWRRDRPGRRGLIIRAGPARRLACRPDPPPTTPAPVSDAR